MMALKSGLLAESTWALDTLNILLYDDSTISYFSLNHLPGLLEVLLEHFRRCLIEIFGEPFITMEKHTQASPQPKVEEVPTPIKTEVVIEESENIEEEAEEKKDEEIKDEKENENETDLLENGEESGAIYSDKKLPDYTLTTRNGLNVRLVETDDLPPSDPKSWDVYSGFSFEKGHWQLGCGDTSRHVIPYFASDKENIVYKKLFIRPPMKLKSESELAAMKKEREGDGEEKIEEEVEEQEEHCLCPSEDCSDKDKDSEDPVVTENGSSEEEKISIKNVHKRGVLNCSTETKKLDKESKQEKRNNIIRHVQIKQEICDTEENISVSSDPPAGLEVEVKKEEDASGEDVEEGKDGSDEEVKLEGEEENMETSQDSSGVRVKTENGADSLSGQCCSDKRSHEEVELEDESYQRDEPPLNSITDARDELGRRCICISNVFRSLSCVPGNDARMSKHAGLLFTLGKLLQLHHRHLPRNTTRKKFDRDESELEDLMDSRHIEEEWWWNILTMLRENTLVIFANICGQLRLAAYPEEICMPILDGLLHWAVCPSSCATDPLPSTPLSVLSPQRLVLEAMCKLCIHAANVDLLLATPPFDRIIQLVSILTKLLANRTEPVALEFAIVLLSELVQGEESAVRAIALQHPSISLLLDFLEGAEQKAMQVVNLHGINILRENPEMMGTSLDMLRRAANILLHLSYNTENRRLFGHHQQRLLSLVMSQILDQVVAQILSDVMFQCFQSDSKPCV